MSWCVSLPFLIILSAHVTENKKDTGGYVEITRVENCEEDPGTWESNFIVRKYNRTTPVINFNISSDRDYDDSLTLNSQLSVWSDGGWKHNFVRIERTKACSFFLFLIPDFMKIYYNALKLPPKCPIPKGAYRVENFPARIPMPIRVKKFNQFMSVIKLIDTNTKKTVFCLHTFASNVYD